MSDPVRASRPVRVAALYIHPLKSAQGVRVPELQLDARGAVNDRRWLLVDPHGVAITQRERKRLALIRPSLPSPGLTLDADGRETLPVPVPAESPARLVTVWESDVLAVDAGNEAAAWCSDVIEAPCRLVHLARAAHRPLQQRFAGALPVAGRDVAFTDGAPLLVLGQGSVDALNARLAARGEPPVPAERFRANLLLEGADAHEEDRWSRARIGAVELSFGSPCARCVMTTIDQRTLAQSMEPLRTFADYRRLGSGVVFGINTTHTAPGTVSTGAAVEVLEWRASGEPRTT